MYIPILFVVLIGASSESAFIASTGTLTEEACEAKLKKLSEYAERSPQIAGYDVVCLNTDDIQLDKSEDNTDKKKGSKGSKRGSFQMEVRRNWM